MLRTLLLNVFLVGVALGVAACGGSSSETPLPLPPHPLNEPYRVRGAVQSRDASPAAEGASAEDASEGEFQERPARGSNAPGSTWGSKPEALPELSPK